MPVTREQIEEELAGLPQEQHAAFLAEVERRMAAAAPPTPMRPNAPPKRGASFWDFQGWRQNAMGDLGRSEPQTPEEVDASTRGALTGAAATGVIAAPLAALKLAGSGATGFVAGEATHAGLKKFGVNDTVADYAGTGVSMLAGGGVGAGMVRGGVKGAVAGKLKSKILSFFAGAGKKSSPEVMEEAMKIGSKILDLKNTQKLSDPQIINVLRELYALPAKDAREFMKLVLGT